MLNVLVIRYVKNFLLSIETSCTFDEQKVMKLIPIQTKFDTLTSFIPNSNWCVFTKQGTVLVIMKSLFSYAQKVDSS